MGPRASSRATSYSSTLLALRAISDKRPVRPARFLAVFKGRLRSTAGSSPGKLLVNLFEVDAVLSNDYLQVPRVSVEVVAPLLSEDVGLGRIGRQHYAGLVLVEDYWVFGDPTPADRVAAVDRVARPKALYARGCCVELLSNPLVPPPFVDPASDLSRMRL